MHSALAILAFAYFDLSKIAGTDLGEIENKPFIVGAVTAVVLFLTLAALITATLDRIHRRIEDLAEQTPAAPVFSCTAEKGSEFVPGVRSVFSLIFFYLSVIVPILFGLLVCVLLHKDLLTFVLDIPNVFGMGRGSP